MQQPINIENRNLNKKIIEEFLIENGFVYTNNRFNAPWYIKDARIMVGLCLFGSYEIDIIYIINKVKYEVCIPLNIYKSLDRAKSEIKHAMFLCGLK